jgi:hypothetical protein
MINEETLRDRFECELYQRSIGRARQAVYLHSEVHDHPLLDIGSDLHIRFIANPQLMAMLVLAECVEDQCDEINQ